MAEPGKVIKPRSRSAQFSLGSILTVKGNVIPFFNPVEYLKEGDLVLYDVKKEICRISYKRKKIGLPISIAVLDENYPTSLTDAEDEGWSKKDEFRELWEATWKTFLKKYPCGFKNLELDIKRRDFFCLWSQNEVYLASIKRNVK